MRLRTLVTAVLVAVAAITGSVGVSHITLTGNGSLGSSGSLDFGSSADDVVGPVSGFLWQNPGGRYIVVLGAKVGTLGQTPEILDQRLSKAAALGRTHPFNRIIASGGGTWWLPVSEAQFMNVGLIQRGIPVWQMVNEGTSRSTVENAGNTVRMLKAMGADGAVIVTNGFHMQRAMKNFRDAARAQRARITFMSAYA
ncbi:MAG TPA: YdcF family protein [Gordonia sp. (in: high G+C Gram-positive bacteria)]|uniref:YdcF family protein n=1 Tax=unclassified Gordonia (in: high G+C Gram-positive bacteria) TaxID=2657482 RepID=UPI000F8FDB96|nr:MULTISPECIES: YdcF family protein [unclassified Gordonia (in: high G+C Gram-positive bacteria)]RTL09671.1 MAG: YdcF family protein [Acidimicrobiia bacterium]HNP58472.1 YdcF family protein [Gordonia sp. (in: high G+C Gram-positive bacteria)]HRC51688.1 YdcF family protein [Gordonia sp. (in: high G+C Gram-positive bacteria)]